jgi:hypothetical protein
MPKRILQTDPAEFFLFGPPFAVSAAASACAAHTGSERFFGARDAVFFRTAGGTGLSIFPRLCYIVDEERISVLFEGSK